MEQGYIKLHRQIIESSVWKSPEVVMVWMWCLIKATHKDTKFAFNGGDMELKAGGFITGRTKALKELRGLSPRKYRTALNYLKTTNRIAIKTTSQFSIISIVNWEQYQKATNGTTSKTTSQRPASDQPATTYKNDKNDKNVKKSGAFCPPSLQEVKDYCLIRKNNVDAGRFIDFYESKGWLVGKNKMKNWQAAVRTWEGRDKAKVPEVDIKEPEYLKR